MDKKIIEKVRQCKALQGKTVADIIASPEFLANLGKYLEAQQQDRKAIEASYGAMRKLGSGFRLPTHPLQKFIDWDAERFAAEYGKVLNGVSALPAAQRKYIQQLGDQALNLTIAEAVCAEFPELREKLIPSTKQN